VPTAIPTKSRLAGSRRSRIAAVTAAKIGTALRNQYVLGFAPAEPKRDGKYHKIQVKIARPAGVPPLRASFRSGYTAPSN